MTPLGRVLAAVLAAAALIAALLFAWIAFVLLLALAAAVALTMWALRLLRGRRPPRGPVVIEGEYREEPERRAPLEQRER